MWVWGWGTGKMSFCYGRVPAGKLQGQDFGEPCAFPASQAPSSVGGALGAVRTGMCSSAYGFPVLGRCVFSVDTLSHPIQDTHPNQSKSIVGLPRALIFSIPGL